MRGLGISFLIGLLISLSSYESCCDPEPEPRLRKVHTERLGQHTGTQFNRRLAMGITETDLGVSFMSADGDRLFLLWLLEGRRYFHLHAGHAIGIDRATGQHTSIYTIITTTVGNLVTAFPAVP